MLKKIYTLFCCLLFIQIVNAQSTAFQWAKQFGGDSSNGQFLSDFKTDPLGNTYTLGYFSGTIDLDPGLSIYNVTSTGSLSFFIVKLNASGNFIWAKKYTNGSEVIGHSISVDQSGNVYTTGYFNKTTNFDLGYSNFTLNPLGKTDIFILKLSSSGAFVWAKQLGGNSYNQGNAITCDEKGNVYTSGYFRGSIDLDPGAASQHKIAVGGFDAYILKLSTEGHFIWAKTIGGKKNDGYYNICLDNFGNVYSSGRFSDTLNFYTGTDTFQLTSKARFFESFVTKLDTSGNFKWAIKFGDSLLDADPFIVADKSENLILTGGYYGKPDFDPGPSITNYPAKGEKDFYAVKLNASGNLVWIKTLGNLDVSISGASAILDDTGNVYVIGDFNRTIDFNPGGTPAIKTTNHIFADPFILKLDLYGHYIWSKQIAGTGDDKGFGIGIDAKNNLYLSGSFGIKSDFDPDSGTFNLTVTKKNVADIFVLKLGDYGSGIRPLVFNNSVSVYPNPSNGIFNIALQNTSDKASITVYNALGEIVYSRIHSNEAATIDLSHEANGLYIVKVIDDNQSIHTLKIIKE